MIKIKLEISGPRAIGKTYLIHELRKLVEKQWTIRALTMLRHGQGTYDEGMSFEIVEMEVEP